MLKINYLKAEISLIIKNLRNNVRYYDKENHLVIEASSDGVLSCQSVETDDCDWEYYDPMKLRTAKLEVL